ncbi:hypothetical protein K438DRAFT_1992620 [Mycena galopus ATCC 62051]|nr:hypothetical protein K438DRAFT_1992620 [Mycena galopus ATCC 62051]
MPPECARPSRSFPQDDGETILDAGVGFSRGGIQPALCALRRIVFVCPSLSPCGGSNYSECGAGVREAWAFDWQSHGAAAILNCALLESSRAEGVSAYEWAGAIVLSTRAFSVPNTPFHALVLIEPTMAARQLYNRTIAHNTPTMEAATMVRRWRGRAEAAAWLMRWTPYRRWDARMLNLFIQHGLEDTPGGEVTLNVTGSKRLARTLTWIRILTSSTSWGALEAR